MGPLNSSTSVWVSQIGRDEREPDQLACLGLGVSFCGLSFPDKPISACSAASLQIQRVTQ